MGFLRRPAAAPDAAVDDAPTDDGHEVVDVVGARLDRLDARLAVLEARFADADEAAIVLPDQGDVLDAQVRAARLSAEVHLVAIELRSELQRLRSDWTASDEAVDLIDHLVELTADA